MDVVDSGDNYIVQSWHRTVRPTVKLLAQQLQRKKHLTAERGSVWGQVQSSKLRSDFKRSLKVINQFDFLQVSFQINFAKNQTYLVSTATC